MSDTVPNISLMDSFGELANEMQSVELFSKHFSSVFNSPVDRGTDEPLLATTNCISDIVLTEELVKQQLERLDESKSPGPDGVHPKILRI